jgi:hypothetical protein
MNPDDNDAWDLATLAAQLLRRRNTESDAVDAAWALVEASKHKLEGIRLQAWAKSPEARADWETQQTEYQASLKIPYKKAMKLITSQVRLDHARKLFKDFLAAKAEKDREAGEREAWVEARLVHYSVKDFTGTEAKKLKEEFEQWRGKGRQGRVKKRATDGRLRENRRKKKHAEGKAALAGLTKPKQEFTRHYEIAVMKGARGRKTPNYRDPATYIPDTDKA